MRRYYHDLERRDSELPGLHSVSIYMATGPCSIFLLLTEARRRSAFVGVRGLAKGNRRLVGSGQPGPVAVKEATEPTTSISTI